MRFLRKKDGRERFKIVARRGYSIYELIRYRADVGVTLSALTVT